MRHALVLFGLVACSSASSSDAPAAPEPVIACGETPIAAASSGFFTDISAASGIQHANFVANPATPIPINDHSRLAFADIDGDGLDDIVAHSLFPNPQKGIPFEHLVFRNRGDKTFEDVSDASGLRSVQAAFFVFGDVDNDGDQDCFAGLDIDLAGQHSSIWLNDGHGHFNQIERSGLEAAERTANAVFADFDGDGKLDLYAGNGGTTSAERDQLFLGSGDGTFRDASANLENRPLQPTNGVVACDYDDDGDLDILVSHYGVSESYGWRTLWENDGHGRFANVAEKRGFHALGTGNSWLESTGRGHDVQPGDPKQWIGANGFGIDCVDVDGDGHLDVWVASISHPVDSDETRKWSDPSQLLLNGGPHAGFAFSPATTARGIPFNEGDIDAAAVDYDNDGLVDLAVSRDKKYEGSYSTPDQMSWFGLLRQRPNGTFASVGLKSGINDPSGATDRAKAGQNIAWSDIDGDGDLDLLVGGRDNGGRGRANFLFENTAGQKNAWVGIRLRGDGRDVNRDAIGARVTIITGDRRIVREVKSSRGTYSSADSRALLFGLGDHACGAKVEIRWPNGRVDTHDALPGRYASFDYSTP